MDKGWTKGKKRMDVAEEQQGTALLKNFFHGPASGQEPA